MSKETNSSSIELAIDVTVAWLSNPNTRVEPDAIASFIQTIHATVDKLANADASEVAEPAKEEFTPAVSVRRSLGSKDHILSLIDGKPYKTLTRHLSTHGLTQDQYRQRYNLRSDYPMVAENYAAQRRELAKSIGLGRRPRAEETVAKPAAKKTATPRKTKAPAPKSSN